MVMYGYIWLVSYNHSINHSVLYRHLTLCMWLMVWTAGVQVFSDTHICWLVVILYYNQNKCSWLSSTWNHQPVYAICRCIIMICRYVCVDVLYGKMLWYNMLYHMYMHNNGHIFTFSSQNSQRCVCVSFTPKDMTARPLLCMWARTYYCLCAQTQGDTKHLQHIETSALRKGFIGNIGINMTRWRVFLGSICWSNLHFCTLQTWIKQDVLEKKNIPSKHSWISGTLEQCFWCWPSWQLTWQPMCDLFVALKLKANAANQSKHRCWDLERSGNCGYCLHVHANMNHYVSFLSCC